MDWIRSIEKYQIDSRNTHFDSYYNAVVDDKLYFAFNASMRKKTDINLSYVDALGKLGGKTLFNARDEGVLLSPTGCRQIDDHRMIIG